MLKVPTFNNINQVIALPVFYPEPSSDEELRLHSMDVPRSLKMYLDRTMEFRKDENLLILFSGKNRGLKALIPTLSRRTR